MLTVHIVCNTIDDTMMELSVARRSSKMNEDENAKIYILWILFVVNDMNVGQTMSRRSYSR